MRSWALTLGVAACAMLTVVDPAMPDEAISRPVTLQYLPAQQPLPAAEALSRAATLQYLPAQQPLPAAEALSRAATSQFLPARRPPPANEAMARAFTVQTLGVPLAVPSDSTVDRPGASALHGTEPNPFNRATLIRYALAARERVRLRVYDLAGRVVRALVMNEQSAGEHVVTWDGVGHNGQRLSPGVYLCRLEAGTFDECRRIVLVGK